MNENDDRVIIAITTISGPSFCLFSPTASIHLFSHFSEMMMMIYREMLKMMMNQIMDLLLLHSTLFYKEDKSNCSSQ